MLVHREAISPRGCLIRGIETRWFSCNVAGYYVCQNSLSGIGIGGQREPPVDYSMSHAIFPLYQCQGE
jgi:hypothetical protein